METTGSKLTNLSDTDLVRLAADQNQAAYIVLYTRYNAGVKSHISRYVSQKEDIEDICLESFQKAFSQIGSYNPEYKFSTWLYRQYGIRPSKQARQGKVEYAYDIHQ